MRNNSDDRIIVESTAQMAHALRLELVAEGVETEWDAQFLAAAGYDYAQGFRYSRALAGRQVPGLDRGVQCHRDAHRWRHRP